MIRPADRVQVGDLIEHGDDVLEVVGTLTRDLRIGGHCTALTAVDMDGQLYALSMAADDPVEVLGPAA